MKRMGIVFCICCIAFAGMVTANEEEVASPAEDVHVSLKRDLGALDKKLDQQQKELQRRLSDAEGRLSEISNRLGEGFGRTTTFNTIERRLAAVEKKVDEMDRLMKRMETRLTALERKR